MSEILQQAIDQKFGLLLWGVDEDGEDDVMLYIGTLRKVGDSFRFNHGSSNAAIDINTEWYNRITAVPDDLRDSLNGCRYQLSLSIGDVTEEQAAHYTNTGMRWPGA